MGIWGTDIYQDDVAEDVKSVYIDQLRRGKSSEEATKELMLRFRDYILDADDAPVFWFALADIQWEYGRLEDSVKEKAIFYIHESARLKEWEIKPDLYRARKNTLDRLEKKILAPQPTIKKISPYRLYSCRWQINDVYAYSLDSPYAQEKGVCGRYLLFIKTGIATWWPGHIIPIVRVKITNDAQLPTSFSEVDRLDYIQISATNPMQSIVFHDAMLTSNRGIDDKFIDEYGYMPQYQMKLINTSKRIIPSKLLFLGNYPDIALPTKEYIPKNELEIYSVAWKFLEKNLIDRYFGHNLKQFSIYKEERK